MDKVTDEQAYYILKAIHKIISSVALLAAGVEGTEDHVELLEEGKKALIKIGVPFEE